MMKVLKILLSFFVMSNAMAASLFGPDYIDLSTIPNVKVDLRYATTNNFTHQKVYGDLTHAYLHKIAYDKLVKAAKILAEQKPKWKFIVFDALRPRSVQKRLWAVVKGTPEAQYVMDPKKGSFHNYGLAVDIGLIDENGKEIDMGTGFDNFTRLAQPEYETQNVAAGKLTAVQVKHRRILRNCLEDAGFKQLPIEWWHFDAVKRTELEKYPIVE